MTTITNFINANFIVQQADSDQEVPIWVLTAPPATRPRLLLNHLIAQCEAKNKYTPLYIGLWFIWIWGSLHCERTTSMPVL